MSKILTNESAEVPSKSTTLQRVRQESSSSRAKYFLGIDGGGTKTHAVITDASFQIIGEGFSGAGNPLRAGLEEAVAHVEQAIADACAEARIEPADIDSACAAISITQFTITQ
jgi:N-acetylglucosamine kinase-like BadF-type ATPase